MLITKGAFENIFEVCKRMSSGDEVLPLDDPRLRPCIHQSYTDWSAQGYRVLGVASCPVVAKGTLHARTKPA